VSEDSAQGDPGRPASQARLPEPFVHLVELEELAALEREADRAAAESGLAQYGRLLHTWQAILDRPGLFAAYLPFLRAVAGPGSLPAGLKELSALLVAHLNNCRYTVSHRGNASLSAGRTPEQMRQVVSGDWAAFDEATRAALQATREVTLLPPQVAYDAEPGVLEPETLAALRSHFDDEQIVELVMSISIWNGLARFHRTMQFTLDMPPAPEGVDLPLPGSSGAVGDQASEGH